MYVASPDCVTCEVEGGLALLDLRSNTYFGLDAVGADVWGMMVNPVSVDAITKAIASEYSVTEGECRGDIVDLLDEMVSNGLVTAA